MNGKDIVLTAWANQGKADALDLRGRAKDMDGTAIIAERQAVPNWDGTKDYSAWPVGAPVVDEGRTYGLIQPHNAAHYPDARPAALPALWSIQHTTDPEKAEPYLAPNGTSGMYMAGECCTDDGVTYRSTTDNNVWRPSEYPEGWEEVPNGPGT